MQQYDIFQGKFGLERETLRVDKTARLAQTPHPFSNPQLARDFCENQLEIITPACDSIPEMLAVLERLDKNARETLALQNETLWLYSNPPGISGEAEIPIARFHGVQADKSNYRYNLQRRYGKRLMLYSGIHFNLSFSGSFIQRQYVTSHAIQSFSQFQDDLYFRLYQQISCYSWVLVLLTAASPIYDLSLEGDDRSGLGFVDCGSMRNSARGYWNQFVPQLVYADLASYVRSIRQYLDKGMLFSAGELYLPVRLKPKGNNSLHALASQGIDHIELRMFDLNPFAPLGIEREDLEFAHRLMLYLLSRAPFDFTKERQAQAIADHKAAAGYDLDKICIGGKSAREQIRTLLGEMRAYFAWDEDSLKWIDLAEEKLLGKRLCQQVYASIHQDGMTRVATRGKVGEPGV